MKKVLLHVCCGVCAFYCIQRLTKEGYYVESFFYNPNIYPEEEYLKRRFAAKEVATITKTKITEGPYVPQAWLKECQDYKDAKEGGERCLICYRTRLIATQKEARDKNFDFFTTTLTISPHKDNNIIAAIGQEVGGGAFLPVNFKKQDGFKKTLELAKKYNLYRQNYCGCIYSIAQSA
ncbi:MAG: epoxyqueuosine reductase QueH [Candidatus Omnitrophota bacterium]